MAASAQLPGTLPASSASGAKHQRRRVVELVALEDVAHEGVPFLQGDAAIVIRIEQREAMLLPAVLDRSRDSSAVNCRNSSCEIRPS